MLFVAVAAAVITGMGLGWVIENYLTKSDNANFDSLYAWKIKQFIAQHNLKPIEFLSISRCHLEKDSRLLQQIHRHF
jgi:hypothetical protein